MNSQLTRASKFISLVLRHEPQTYGLALDKHGWALLDDVVAAANRAGLPLTHDQVRQIVAQNDKQRFALSANGSAIRARQGHSVAVDLELVALEPPALLYHGTAERTVAAIREQGLLARSRQQVHLSTDIETAIKVGQRHGKPVVVSVASGEMYRAGYCFFRSENGVWLVDAVPSQYLGFPEPTGTR